MAATVDQRPQYGQPDARTGLGYGLTQSSGRNDPRSAGSVYPYHEPPVLDQDDHEELDDEMNLDSDVEDAIRSRTLGTVLTTDFLAGSGTDPFYFAAGNTKLSEAAMGTSMVPFPRMYAKAKFSAGPSYLKSLGPTYGFGSTSVSSGSKKGNSKGVLTVAQALDDEVIDSFEDLFDYESMDEKHVELIRNYTREILRRNGL